jgi:hypothetical protein
MVSLRLGWGAGTKKAAKWRPSLREELKIKTPHGRSSSSLYYTVESTRFQALSQSFFVLARRLIGQILDRCLQSGGFPPALSDWEAGDDAGIADSGAGYQANRGIKKAPGGRAPSHHSVTNQGICAMHGRYVHRAIASIDLVRLRTKKIDREEKGFSAVQSFWST